MMNLKPAFQYFLFIQIFFSFFTQTLVTAESLDHLKIMTEEYPPYNYKEDGKLKGIAVDTMVLMLERSGSKLKREDIGILPWARGYNETLNNPGTCLFSTTRTPEREKLFKWVGPVGINKMVLTAKKDKKIVIQNTEDLKKYKTGVIIEDIVDQILSAMHLGEGCLEKVSMTTHNIKKLNSGRIDMIGYGEDAAKWEIKRHGFSPADYETVYVLQSKDLYFAFHKDTPDEIIRVLQKNLDELKKEGEYQKILDLYLK